VHKVLLETAARKDLDKLSHSDFDRVFSAIKKLSGNPRPGGCAKIVGSENDWRIRIGIFRVIYEINDKQKVIRIMRIKHRREAYR
jgi:mRNA interferase RelE/StbE